MPKIVTLCLGVISTSLAASLVSQCLPGPLSYSKVVILSFLFFLPSQFIWACIIAPIHFSSLSAIAKAPRVPGLAGFLKPRSSEQILDWTDTIPNDGLLRYLDIFNTEVITVTDPRMIADFLGAKAYHFIKTPRLRRILERLLGPGLITTEGALHKLQRKNLLPAFNLKVVKALTPLFWEKATDMTELIKNEIVTKGDTAGKTPVKINIEDWAGRVSLDIIGKAGFGSEFSALQNPNTPLNTAYREAFVPDGTSKLFFLLTLLTSPKVVSYLPFKKNDQIRDGVAAVTDFIKKLIDERKRQMFLNVDDKNYFEKSGQNDIMAIAMQSGAFSNDNLVDQCKTLLGAGHETSAGAVTFGIQLLSEPEHAHIQEKLRKEIRANLPSPSSGIPIDADMIDRLPYLEAVSKESMRVYGPVPMIGRVAAVDTDICGVSIPKGTNVRVHPWAVNKAKNLWGEDAKEFKPERWLEGKDAANGGAETLAYLTFGHGPRGCIGRGFAQGENKALLAALIGSFEFKTIPGSKPDVIFGITARIIGGPQVTASIVEGW